MGKLTDRRGFLRAAAGACAAAALLGAGCGDREEPVPEPEPEPESEPEFQQAPDSTPEPSAASEPAAPIFDFAAKTVTLNSGFAMPILGLGTWTLTNAQAEDSTYAALAAGMRLIDTARYYRCEAGVGRGIARAIADGLVAREDVFVTSKIMPSDYSRAAAGIDESLADLGLSYVDLMLIHQPRSRDADVYRAMEDAAAAGKVRSIGISNYYTRAQVDEVLSYARVTPAVIQNENHLRFTNGDLKGYVAQWGIALETWYPFGGRAHVREHLAEEAVANAAAAHGKTAAQVIARWHLQSGYVCIPGSADAGHIAENAAVFDFELLAGEMAALDALGQGRRYENW